MAEDEISPPWTTIGIVLIILIITVAFSYWLSLNVGG